MIEFIRGNKKLSLALLLSLLFFLRKGLQYAVIGSYIPFLIIISLILLLIIAIKKGKKGFVLIARFWAITIIIWALMRLLFSIVHYTVKSFDNSFHLTQQFSGLSLTLSIVMLVLGVIIFRQSNKKRLKDWL